jgi:hypothetical protein
LSRFVNFLGGMNIRMLPVSNIGGILFNTPEILKTKSAQEKIRDIIRKANPGYTMVDSGGYQAFKVKDNNRDVAREEQTKLIMNDDKPIYGRKTFNLTAKHVLDAVLLIGPDFVISPDIPVPMPDHPDQKRFLFLESLGYNVYCAGELSRMLREHHLGTKLLIPLQLFDLFEYDYFTKQICNIDFAGLSVPRRIMSNEKLALFILKARSMGITYLHLLGSGRMAHIAILAYMARHYMNFLSLDSTNIFKFSSKSQYLRPFSLIPVDLRLEGSEDDLAVPISCDCSWCPRYKSFYGIQYEGTEEKFAFLVNHNHFVVDQAMAEFMKHADTAASLAQFLESRTGRHRDIRSIYNILSQIELLKKAALNPAVLEAMFNKYCR